MSVTVVDWLYALPEQEAALTEVTLTLAGRIAASEGGPPPSAYRGYLDPGVMLIVADWGSREVHRAWLTAHAAALDQLLAAPLASTYFRLERTYGVMGRSAAVALCELIRVPTGSGEAARALWGEGTDLLRSVDGFSHWYAFADEDDTNHFMTISAWETPAAAEAYLGGPAFQMLRRLSETGATLEPFFGVPDPVLRRETG